MEKDTRMGTQASHEPALAPGTPARKSRKDWWVVVGVAAIVAGAVLVGGALVSGVLAASGRGGLFNRPEGDRPNFQIVPAAELPTSPPNVRGVVTQRAGQTISVAERGGFGQSSEPNQAGDGAASQVEVAVTQDTVFYHDITRANLNEGAPGGAIQQQLEAGALDGINANSRVTVWGDQSGQQLTAKVLVYSDPIASRQP
jgi:hypothetical protein